MFNSIIFVLCLLFTALIVVKSSIVPQIDNPTVRCSTIEIPTVKTDFLYNYFLKHRHNFHIDVNNKLMNIKSVLVQPNNELKIIFSQKSLNFMLVRQLDNGNFEKVFESKEITNETSSITTPSKPGKYVYSISATYTEGVGIYYFSIEVEEK